MRCRSSRSRRSSAAEASERRRKGGGSACGPRRAGRGGRAAAARSVRMAASPREGVEVEEADLGSGFFLEAASLLTRPLREGACAMGVFPGVRTVVEVEEVRVVLMPAAIGLFGVEVALAPPRPLPLPRPPPMPPPPPPLPLTAVTPPPFLKLLDLLRRPGSMTLPILTRLASGYWLRLTGLLDFCKLAQN